VVASPIVVILESRNVILTKIGPALDLDKDQKSCSEIGDAMFSLRRDKRFLICLQSDLAFSQCDYRFAGDDHPVLAPALMHLQTEAVTGVYFNAFHFVALALGEHFVSAPGACVFFDEHGGNDFTPVGGMSSQKVRTTTGEQKEKGDGCPSPRSHTENPRFA